MIITHKEGMATVARFPLSLRATQAMCFAPSGAGQKEQEANNFLEKRFKTDPNPSLSYDDTVQFALACLQNVLGSDLKASDIEVRGAAGGRAMCLRPSVLTGDAPPARSVCARRLAQACVVRNENLKFTRLTADEVEAHLTALAERDDDIVARE